MHGDIPMVDSLGVFVSPDKNIDVNPRMTRDDMWTVIKGLMDEIKDYRKRNIDEFSRRQW